MSEIASNIEPEKEEDAYKSRMRKMIRSHSIQLGEHFDSVQIICTKHFSETDTTSYFTDGYGNYAARQGSVRDWVTENDERSRENGRNE